MPQDLNTSSPLTNDTPTHFNVLIEEKKRDEEQKKVAEVSSKLISLEEFQQSFIGLHGIASSFTGIQALTIPNSHVKEPTANDVAAVMYKNIRKIPMLHFILSPESTWLGDAFVMVVYVQGMRKAIGEELNTDEKASVNFSSAKRATQQPTEDGEPSEEQAAALGA
ncbi:MAG: hypothetical protein COB36_11020 [Alphaproteobacteria bacterium]|nr:MAG: hypothetical protein COB36_11020 [Alphaproteobacteria bacterium]